MAFKHTAADMSARYEKHQSIAKTRVGMKNGMTGIPRGQSATPARGHGPLPKQTAPGVNRTQTIQKDINKSKPAPKQGPATSMNRLTLQPDLNGSKKMARGMRPGANK